MRIQDSRGTLTLRESFLAATTAGLHFPRTSKVARWRLKGRQGVPKVKTASMDAKTTSMDAKTASMDDKTASMFRLFKSMVFLSKKEK